MIDRFTVTPSFGSVHSLRAEPLPVHHDPPAKGGASAARSQSVHPAPGEGGAVAGRLVIECPTCHTSIVVEEPAVRAAAGGDRDPVVLHLRGPLPAPDLPLEDVVHHVEAELVLRALEQTGGVKLHAAELLGMKYSTFWELARRLGLEVEDAADVETGVELDLVERVDLVLGSDDEEGKTLGFEVPIPAGSGLMSTAVEGVRARLARRALDRCDGKLTCAAESVGMKYTTFHSLVQRLGLRE